MELFLWSLIGFSFCLRVLGQVVPFTSTGALDRYATVILRVSSFSLLLFPRMFRSVCMDRGPISTPPPHAETIAQRDC